MTICNKAGAICVCGAAAAAAGLGQYSGAGDGRPLPTVLAITTGSINRGACIVAFSQYPGEVLISHARARAR